MNKKVVWITKTAAFTALLIVMQAVTAPLGNTLITGSIVNLILVVSVMLCGFASGLAVALISPVFAFTFGIGTPLIAIVPFIMAGNVTLVLTWHFIGNYKFYNKYVAYIAALISAAILKFLVLYIGIVKIAIPMLLELPERQASVMSVTFSTPQIITALVGGSIAAVILPVLKKALGQYLKD